ncbi:hypothetical protein [Lysinibacillus sp. ZYM-1]|uniref:hypothetical protein n=1 Tax=Lysinibacillus sp. ZYM-1 TaxID=1681184 RepID=UPI0006CE7CDB|nr:hypothetical protein [Lysinibacillus sp. ZYM-1]KPN95270.1 hypothetical protein AO843_03570 [Lysinibacillus sp. ZYM-1]
MKVGTRIIYEENSKNVVTVLHRMEGDALERSKELLVFVDIPFDEFDPITHLIKGIDSDGNAIIETISLQETDEQKRIRELEDTLLLQTDNEIGGIL